MRRRPGLERFLLSLSLLAASGCVTDAVTVDAGSGNTESFIDAFTFHEIAPTTSRVLTYPGVRTIDINSEILIDIDQLKLRNHAANVLKLSGEPQLIELEASLGHWKEAGAQIKAYVRERDQLRAQALRLDSAQDQKRIKALEDAYRAASKEWLDTGRSLAAAVGASLGEKRLLPHLLATTEIQDRVQRELNALREQVEAASAGIGALTLEIEAELTRAGTRVTTVPIPGYSSFRGQGATRVSGMRVEVDSAQYAATAEAAKSFATTLKGAQEAVKQDTASSDQVTTKLRDYLKLVRVGERALFSIASNPDPSVTAANKTEADRLRRDTTGLLLALIDAERDPSKVPAVLAVLKSGLASIARVRSQSLLLASPGVPLPPLVTSVGDIVGKVRGAVSRGALSQERITLAAQFGPLRFPLFGPPLPATPYVTLLHNLHAAFDAALIAVTTELGNAAPDATVVTSRASGLERLALELSWATSAPALAEGLERVLEATEALKPGGLGEALPDDPSNFLIPRRLTSTPKAVVKLTNVAREDGDSLQIRLRFKKGDELLEAQHLDAYVSIIGPRFLLSPSVAFVRRTERPDRNDPNAVDERIAAAPGVGARLTYHFREDDSGTLRFLNFLDWGVMGNVHLLNFDSGEDFELGFGGGLSLFGDVITVGYGWNASVSKDRDYVYFGPGFATAVQELYDAWRKP